MGAFSRPQALRCDYFTDIDHDVIAHLSGSGVLACGLFLWPEVPNLHDGSSTPAGHHHRRLALECNSPDSFRRLAQFPDQLAGTKIPHLDSAVRATGYDSGLVELEARDAVIVGGEAVDGRERVEGPDADRTIGSAGHECGGRHLKLADEGCMALEDSQTLSVSWSVNSVENAKPKIGSLPVNRVPYPDACIQTACGDPVAIKRDGVDLTEMPL